MHGVLLPMNFSLFLVLLVPNIKRLKQLHLLVSMKYAEELINGTLERSPLGRALQATSQTLTHLSLSLTLRKAPRQQDNVWTSRRISKPFTLLIHPLNITQLRFLNLY